MRLPNRYVLSFVTFDSGFDNPILSMVGYTESMTDPPYEGQILVLTTDAIDLD